LANYDAPAFPYMCSLLLTPRSMPHDEPWRTSKGLIQRSAWKVNSEKHVCSVLYGTFRQPISTVLISVDGTDFATICSSAEWVFAPMNTGAISASRVQSAEQDMLGCWIEIRNRALDPASFRTSENPLASRVLPIMPSIYAGVVKRLAAGDSFISAGFIVLGSPVVSF
jgi:hypothetical protein